MQIQTFTRFVRKRVEVDVPAVEDKVWEKYELMAAVPLWKVIALCCDLDPDALVGSRKTTFRQVGRKGGTILRRKTITVNLPASIFDQYADMFTITSNCLRHRQGITAILNSNIAQLRTVRLHDFVRFADSKGWQVPNRLRLMKPSPDAEARAGKQSKDAWKQPGTFAYEARQIAEEMLQEARRQKKSVGIKALSISVADELVKLGRPGPRGKFWSAETVRREALKGITGRKPKGR